MTPSFTCPRCGAVSYNPNDIANAYCGRCHVFVDDQRKIDTAYVMFRLAPYYEPAEMQVWLNAIHPQLDARPIDLIAKGRTAEITAVIDRLDECGYL